MSALESSRAKVALLSMLVVCASVFVAQLWWLRQVGGVSPSPGFLVLFMLAPLGTTGAFLGLWYLGLQRQTSSSFAKPWFWLVSALCLAFWVAVLSVFIIGPDVQVTA